jgi:ferrochelatase
MGERTGVLVMAYGTPATPDDVEAYYTHVRRGRPPTPELLADLRRRYSAIGGTSPLLELTRRQAAGLQAELGDAYVVSPALINPPP